MTIRWALLGCGDVADRSSAPALQGVPGAQISVVMSRRLTAARSFAERHGIPAWTADADEAVALADAVYVATPPDSHLEHVLRCAAARTPVCVEKPMANDVGDAERMVRACDEAGVPLWVAYYRRALPRVLAVRDLLAQGVVGRVLAVRTVQLETQDAVEAVGGWRLDPERVPGGLLVERACHALDLLQFLLGPVVDCWGTSADRTQAFPSADTVAGAFRFDGGALGSGVWCYAAGQQHDRTEVLGTRGALSFCISRPEDVRVSSPSGERVFTIPDPPFVHQPLFTDIVIELEGGPRCASTGHTALATQRVLARLA